SSPAANTLTWMRLPLSAVIACPMRFALLSSPAVPFGQLVAIFNSRMPCEIAGAGKAAAVPAIAPARSIRLRRLTVAGLLRGTASGQDGAWSVVSGLQREAPLVPSPLEIVIVRRPVTTDMVLFLCIWCPSFAGRCQRANALENAS